MSQNVKFEYVNPELIPEHLMCSICQSPFDEPCTTSCDHTFCKQCFKSWIQRGNPSCPVCRQYTNTNQLILSNRIIRNILGELLVECKKCGMKNIKRNDFEHHVTYQRVIFCSAADIMCPWKGLSKEPDNHLAICSYQILRPMLTQILHQSEELKNQAKAQSVETEKDKTLIEELKSKISQQSTQIQKYERETDQLKKQLHKGTLENKDYNKEIFGLKEKITQYTNESQYIKSNVQRESEKNGEYYKKVCRFQENMEKYKAIKENYISKNNELNRQIDRYREEVNFLKKKIDDQYDAQRMEIEQLKYDNKEYRSQIEQLRKGISDKIIRINNGSDQFKNEYSMKERNVIYKCKSATVEVNSQPAIEYQSRSSSSIWARLSKRNNQHDTKRLHKKHLLDYRNL